MTDTEISAVGNKNAIHAPIDFVLPEFPSDRLTGEAGPALMDLVGRGVIRLFDLLIIRKAEDGAVDVRQASEAMSPGTMGWARSRFATSMAALVGRCHNGRAARTPAPCPGHDETVTE